MLIADYEKLAEPFKPPAIDILLVGESPPFTPAGQAEPKYFYNYRTKKGDVLLRNAAYAFLGKKFSN